MYIIRAEAARNAVDPNRRLVKLVDPNLWKPAWPEGSREWQPGHEIRSEALGISVFTAGAEQKVHYHERTWEIYQVLKGQLRFAMKPYRRASWNAVLLSLHDMVVLAPGTVHLAESGGDHVTQVIQAPPAISDQVVCGGEEEQRAAEAALASL
jgi:mannose-6-phosphate isomerase-like protein (cupin superfamily)